MPNSAIISGYAEMWPRNIFKLKSGNKSLWHELDKQLGNPGVYVPYRDDQPYYIGKTIQPVIVRIADHANHSSDRYFRFWNYFSAFLIHKKNKRLLKYIEGILIAAMPLAANSSNPKFKNIPIPYIFRNALEKSIRINVDG